MPSTLRWSPKEKGPTPRKAKQLMSFLGTVMILLLFVWLSQSNFTRISFKAGSIKRSGSKSAHSGGKRKLSPEAWALEKRMVRGTFVFLVQGEGSPSPFWIDVSGLNSSQVIWVSWRINATVNPLPSTMQLHFFPGSTFTKGRNFLWKKALETEFNQRWCFEYMVFCDEDMNGMTILPDNVNDLRRSPGWDATQTMTSALKAVVLFQYLLLEHSPARAGVMKQPQGVQPRWGRCDNCCFQVS